MSIKINFKAIEIDEEGGEFDEQENSRLFGAALLPEKWLEEDVFSLFETFFCQLNLSEITKYDSEHLLPSCGYLYFFIDTEKKPKAVVRYTDAEPDALTDFNDGLEEFDCVPTYKMIINDDNDEIDGCILGLQGDNVAILTVCFNYGNDVFDDSKVKTKYEFVIDRNSLKNREFDKTKLILTKS